MGDGVDHSASLGTVFPYYDIAHALETKTAQRVALILLSSDEGTNLRDLEVSHYAPRPSALARKRAAGATWSTGRPRRAATACGGSRPWSAATVARTRSMALVDPRSLVRTSWMRARSKTAATGPPRMTPVTGAA